MSDTLARDTTAKEDAATARATIKAADGNLNGDAPKGFAETLFWDAAPEDVARFKPDDLAALARQVWAVLAERPAGATKIAVGAPEAKPGTPLRGITTIDIVNEDMPFLVDSVMAELAERGLAVRLLTHPVLDVQRDAAGRLVSVAGTRGDGPRESVIHIHVARIEDEAARADLAAGLRTVLDEVRLVVADWKPMLARVQQAVDEIKADPPPVPVDDVAEAVQFLEWLTAGNFTLLGVSEQRFEGARELAPVPASGLGILRRPDLPLLQRGGKVLTVTPEIRTFFDEPKTLIITKANVRSRVHRRVHLNYIGVKRFDRQGTLSGELRIVGLFTSTAYTRSTRSIPYLRRKVDAVVRRAGFDPDGHSGKALVNVLEMWPRDELFQIDEETLLQFALVVAQLEEQPRVRVLARRDRFDRFVSVLVYVPRDRYDSAVRVRIGNYLAETFDGRVSAYYPSLPDGPLARVHFIIGRDAGETPRPERADLERDVSGIVRTWSDALADALGDEREPGRAARLHDGFRNAFSQGYREAYSAQEASADIKAIEPLSEERPLSVSFHAREHEGAPAVGLKVWSRDRPLALSQRVPVLENLGFSVIDERTFHVTPSGEGRIDAWLHDMLLVPAEGGTVDLDEAGARLATAFLVVMRGMAENDGFNALVLCAGMPWRDVALLRTLAQFLRQIRVRYSQDYLWTTLRKYPDLARGLVALFHARFDPRLDADERQKRDAAENERIAKELDAVASLDEDRIVRFFLNVVRAAIRTNYFQIGEDGQPKLLIAIKFDSRKVDGMPLPKPLYEIFMSSPRVEGVHLRFGKVARGGIRWSDRPQDFRTEILGLVKAQQVKNAVIVPVGAKGGFVPKQMPAGASREVIAAEGIATYKLFIGTLLDLTDNLDADGTVLPPDNVVRHEGDDPYLVVAADKGTATFSDTANGLSQEHGFWLDDAFASGGSVGYDHKAMGITARGAWESVKRHFREMDTDITQKPFSAVGVGDMSGDVFGNGMLRETTTRLIAAFDHRDIFIDPDPDPAKSFEERARLFKLPRSSWQDYDKALLSKGGGIFPRTLKEIVLSPEARAALGFDKDKASPPEIMRAILKAPVDLLFFGGIGTYVRAASETDEQAGDRSNDAVRIIGKDLRVKVVGEGANLGMTQRGRIEAAQAKVRLNTDAIDNSAGVNTSDVEVNIKIGLSLPRRDGRLSLEDRNALLVQMTDEVATGVLRNNYLQTLSLSLTERRGLDDLGFQQRLMQALEQKGELDRAVEYLPDDNEIAERQRRGEALTRPELSVLLAYAKISLYSELLDSSVPDDPYLRRELGRYFPKEMANRFPDALEKHRLRREIIATQLSNSIINRGGPAFVVRLSDQTGTNAAGIATAFAAVRDSYDMPALNEAINALDGKIAGDVQLSLYAAVQDLLLDRLVFFIRNVDLSGGLAGVVMHHQEGIAALSWVLDNVLASDAAAARSNRRGELEKAGVPGDLAGRIAALPTLAAAPDIIRIADHARKPVEAVAVTYFAMVQFFALERIVQAARAIKAVDYYDRLALDRALDTIGDAERRLTAAMACDEASGEEAVKRWVAAQGGKVERVQQAIRQIAMGGLTLSKLTVTASLLSDLAST